MDIPALLFLIVMLVKGCFSKNGSASKLWKALNPKREKLKFHQSVHLTDARKAKFSKLRTCIRFNIAMLSFYLCPEYQLVYEALPSQRPVPPHCPCSYSLPCHCIVLSSSFLPVPLFAPRPAAAGSCFTWSTYLASTDYDIFFVYI